MSDMTEKRLIGGLKAGYPYLKAGSGLPAWLLPEHSLNSAADKLGDSGILEISQPLDLAKSIVPEQLPDPASFSSEAWQNAVKDWPYLCHVRPVVEAFLEVAERVRAQLPSLRHRIDPRAAWRSMSVILFCPFADQGGELLGDLAGVLGCDAANPAELIRSYATAVERKEILTLEKVNECIVRYSAWDEWAKALQKQILDCQYTPRLIAVTPPLSAELASVLASIMKEGDDESRRDPQRDTGSQVLAP